MIGFRTTLYSYSSRSTIRVGGIEFHSWESETEGRSLAESPDLHSSSLTNTAKPVLSSSLTNSKAPKAIFEDLKASSSEQSEDLKVVKSGEIDLRSRMETYLKEKGWPQEYVIDDLEEKDLLLDWLGCHLLFERPLKSTCCGAPSTQKSLMFEMLKRVLNLYFADVKNEGFAGVHDSYDLWVLDLFDFPMDDISLPWEELVGSTKT